MIEAASKGILQGGSWNLPDTVAVIVIVIVIVIIAKIIGMFRG